MTSAKFSIQKSTHPPLLSIITISCFSPNPHHPLSVDVLLEWSEAGMDFYGVRNVRPAPKSSSSLVLFALSLSVSLSLSLVPPWRL